MTSELREQRKRRRELLIIGITLLLLGILTSLGIRTFRSVPIEEANIVIYALLHVDVILLLLVAYLVIRNVLKILFERQKGKLAEHLQTRIAVAFLFLALVPTVFLFLVAFKFIDTSLGYWFSTNLDRRLQQALLEAQSLYQEKERELSGKAEEFIRRYLVKTSHIRKKHIRYWRRRLKLDSLEIYESSGQLIKGSYSQKPDIHIGLPPSLLKQVINQNEPATETSQFKDKVLLRVILPAKYHRQKVAVATGIFLDPGLEKLIRDVGKGVEAYRQLKFFKDPLKISLLLLLLLVTLLSLFVAIWFGMRFAKRLTEPVHALAEATSQIAAGNFDVDLPPESPDEVGRLVRAFRNMTEELRDYRQKVDETTNALNEANQELRRRTWYLETVLANITAGVVALNDKEEITIINRVAAKLFGQPEARLLGKSIEEILPEPYKEQAKELLITVKRHPKRLVQQPVTVEIKSKRLILAVTVTLLETESGENLGYLCLFEDITEKEKIQRLAAWREVARRIAHEVKNPLTPIQLSAQRLRRRLLERLDEEERQILERCTTTIEKQVEELKHLVNEFSAFARLPALKLRTENLSKVIYEVIDLYRDGHPNVSFEIESDDHFYFSFDREQMKRVFLNLFDNAIRAMGDSGKITIKISKNNGFAKIEVADSGPGIPPEIRPRLFEPYFSYQGGSGLGLAIVNSIIQEHRGKIYVEENIPQGAKFIIELPIEAQYEAKYPHH